MKRRVSGVRCLVSGATIALLGAGPGPLASQTSLSIYSDGRVVVRRTLPQGVERGSSTLRVSLDGLDPATLFSPDTAVSVVSATARFPSVKDAALAAAVGQTLAFVREKGDTVRATVVRTEPPQFRLSDGRMLLEVPGEPLFPAGLVRTAPEAAVVLESSRARPRLQLAYVAQGARWEASYQTLLGRAQAAVTGAATVTSSAWRADSAEVQLVAGAIRRARAPAPPTERLLRTRAEAAALDALVVATGEAREEAVGETHVYDLPGRHTIEPGVPTSVALFPRGSAPYVQELVVPGVLPWRGFFGPQPGEPNRVPVQVWYAIRRARGTPFGDRPLPAGTMQVYQPDSAGRVQLIGEAIVGHTAPGRDVRVQSGDAFDVTAERVQTDYNQEQLPPPRRGMPARQRVTAAYRVTITSAKAEPVTVDVREAHVGNWRIVESSVPAEKLSATEVRFRLPVPANGEGVLTYTVQVES